jgi:hypothetical protein
MPGVRFTVALISCLPALLGVLQNDATPLLIDNPPFFDFFHGPKAAETRQVII